MELSDRVQLQKEVYLLLEENLSRVTLEVSVTDRISSGHPSMWNACVWLERAIAVESGDDPRIYSPARIIGQGVSSHKEKAVEGALETAAVTANVILQAITSVYRREVAGSATEPE